MHSIRIWLATTLGVTLILLLTLLGLIFHFMLRQAVEDHMVLRLDHDTEHLMVSLRFQPNDSLYMPAHRLDPAFQRLHSGRYFQIVSRNWGELRSPSLGEAHLPAPVVQPRSPVTQKVPGPDGQPLLLRAHRLERDGEFIMFIVAEDYTPVLTASRRWQIAFLVLTIVGFMLVLLIQQHLLRRGFAPMEQIRQELDALGQGRLQQLSPQVPSEIQPLVQALNRLLQVLDDRLRRSRRAAGDLAHALKTPLSALQALLDSDAARAIPNRDAWQERLHAMRDRISRELRRARVMGGTAPGAHFQPREDLPDLIQTLKQIYRHKPLDISTQFTLQQPLAADREDMLELFGNLLDNACKWATRCVHLEVYSTTTGWGLSIADDGPGVAEADFPLLIQRGRRLDEQTAGHGLGLAIVHDIIEVYQGQLLWDHDPELGGLRATVTFT